MTGVVALRKQAFKLAGLLLSGDTDQVRQFLNTNGTVSSDQFWIEFVDTATDYLVAPTIGGVISRSNLQSSLPELVGRYFDAAFRLNAKRNIRLRKDALSLAATLNTIDVRPTFLKGMAVVFCDIHDDPGSRLLSDIDVLVPGNQNNKIQRKMYAAGYRRSGVSPTQHDKDIGAFINKRMIAPVDVHRAAFSGTNAEILPEKQIFQHASEIEQEGVVFAIPNPTHMAVLNIGQAQINDNAHWLGQIPLRALDDFANLARRFTTEIDWDEIEYRFASSRKSTALSYYCIAAKEIFHVPIPDRLLIGTSPRLLYSYASYKVGRPLLQKNSYRFWHIALQFRRSFSSNELRNRLFRNLLRPRWWSRHLLNFRKAKRG